MKASFNPYSLAMEGTKEIFAEAFRRLKVRDPNARITVKRIAEEAGFDRHTFYYHFSSIDDLVSWIMDSKLISIIDASDAAWEKAVYSIIAFFSDDSWTEIAQRETGEKYNMIIEKIEPLIAADVSARCEERHADIDRDVAGMIANAATWALAGAFQRCLMLDAGKRGEAMADSLISMIRRFIDDAIAVFSPAEAPSR